MWCNALRCVCVFHRVLLYDYQGMCKANTHSSSGARPLLSVSILLSVLITSTRTQQSDAISVTYITLLLLQSIVVWLYEWRSQVRADLEKKTWPSHHDHKDGVGKKKDEICVMSSCTEILSVTEIKGCHLDSFILFFPSFCFSFFPQPFYNLLAALKWFLSNFLL